MTTDDLNDYIMDKPRRTTQEIIDILDDFQFNYNYHNGSFSEIFTIYTNEKFDKIINSIRKEYALVVDNPYIDRQARKNFIIISQYACNEVEMIFDILKSYSSNYISIIRNDKIEKILK